MRSQTLTEERRELAARHIGLARYIARRMAFKVPHLYSDLLSAGLLGLCEAALRHDGRRDCRFETYAVKRIRGAVLDAMRKAGLKGYRKNPESAPWIASLDDDTELMGDEGDLLGWHEIVAGSDEPPHAQVEADDTIEVLLSLLPRGYSQPMRLLYTRADCATRRDAGNILGLSESCVSQIHVRAVAMLAESFQGADGIGSLGSRT